MSITFTSKLNKDNGCLGDKHHKKQPILFAFVVHLVYTNIIHRDILNITNIQIMITFHNCTSSSVIWIITHLEKTREHVKWKWNNIVCSEAVMKQKHKSRFELTEGTGHVSLMECLLWMFKIKLGRGLLKLYSLISLLEKFLSCKSTC